MAWIDDIKYGNIREEAAGVEAVPTNQSPGYGGSFEHWANDHGSQPLGYGVQQTSGAYKSSEEFLSEGFIESGIPTIDGKTPTELIAAGLLTVENIRPEDQKVVYDDILRGETNNKDMLSSKLDLILSDKDMVNQVVSNQYNKAIEEIQKEKQGFVTHSNVDRKFQFLTTIKMLIEKGYDIDSLSFNRANQKISLAKLVAEFTKESRGAKNIDDPSWFQGGKPPEDYDMRKVKYPSSFAETLGKELYYKNPEKYVKEYEDYLSSPKGSLRQSYEEFLHYGYAIDIPDLVVKAGKTDLSSGSISTVPKEDMGIGADPVALFMAARAENNSNIMNKNNIDAMHEESKQNEGGSRLR